MPSPLESLSNTPIKPGQSGQEWLQTMLSDRIASQQSRLRDVRARNADTSAGLYTPPSEEETAGFEQAARAAALAAMSGQGTFGSSLAAANSTYLGLKKAEQDAQRLAKEKSAQVMYPAQLREEASVEGSLNAALAAAARLRTGANAQQASRFKVVPNRGLVDTQAEGGPQVVLETNNLPALTVQLQRTISQRANGLNFNTAEEKEAWIRQQLSTALAKLKGLMPGLPQDEADSAPQGSAPQGSAPQGSAPQGSAPQGSAPQGSAPQGSAPQGSYTPIEPVGVSKFGEFIQPVQTATAQNAVGSVKNAGQDKVRTQSMIEANKQAAKAFEDKVSPLQTSGEAMLQQLNMLQRMPVPWGAAKSIAVQTLGPVSDALKAMGVGDGGELLKRSVELNSAKPILEGMANALLLQAKGVQTEGDYQRAKNQGPSLTQPKEAAEYTIRMGKAIASRSLDKAQFYSLYAQGNEGSYLGADTRWTDLVKTTPLFAKNSRGQVVFENEFLGKYKELHPKASEAEARAAWREAAK
jgi:hypothetical protein